MKADDIRTVWALARLGFKPDAIGKLRRISRALHNLSERECNGEGWGPGKVDNGRWWPQWTDADEARAEKRREKLMASVQALCNEASTSEVLLDAYNQTDPRGCALYVYDCGLLNGSPIEQVYSGIGVAV